MGEDDDRNGIRRGSEHVQIKGTTEELGQIVPAPVVTEDLRVEVRHDKDEDEQ